MKFGEVLLRLVSIYGIRSWKLGFYVSLRQNEHVMSNNMQINVHYISKLKPPDQF